MNDETNDPPENPLLKRGDRIELIRMGEDAHPLEPGATGTVTFVGARALGIHVQWDNGRTLGLLPDADEYRLLPAEEE